MEFEALIPAGGQANRLGPIPCSKEIFPMPGQYTGQRLRVVCDELIECYRESGISNIHYIIRKGKWDIPALLGDGTELGVHISYHIMNLPYGTPFTLDQAYPFIKGKNIAMGFPDMILRPKDCFKHLMDKLENGSWDIVLGLFPIATYAKWDMIEFDGDRIKEIIIKGNRSDLKYGWSMAVWSPALTEFMHKFLAELIIQNPKGNRKLPGGMERELYVGDIFTEGVKAGLTMSYVLFEDGISEDLGTHKEMEDYLRTYFKTT